MHKITLSLHLGILVLIDRFGIKLSGPLTGQMIGRDMSIRFGPHDYTMERKIGTVHATL